MEWKSWQNLPFAERDRLPEASGIYIIVDSNDRVWYVGKSTNLKNRWLARRNPRQLAGEML